MVTVRHVSMHDGELTGAIATFLRLHQLNHVMGQGQTITKGGATAVLQKVLQVLSHWVAYVPAIEGFTHISIRKDLGIDSATRHALKQLTLKVICERRRSLAKCPWVF